MDKIAVITDSVACLPLEMAEKYGITIVPAGNIYHEGKTCRDWLDLSHSEAYRILEKNPSEFYTGSTTPGEFLELFRKLSKDYNAIIYVSLSAKLSTLQNASRLAVDIAKVEMPGLRIEIFDSATATAAEGFIALAAAKAVQEGKSLDDVIKTARDIKKKVDLFYVLDTVEYVYRTGRVSRTIAKVGSRLNVKPLVTIRNGSANVLGLVRNRDRGIESLFRLAKREINGRPVHIAILHADAIKEADILKQKIAAEFQCQELWIGEFSPLMVYATGKGLLGIAFYTER